ncbi:recombination protein NinB [Pasteurella multocida]|uniref:recombination protein NinB n=1 Tax=Pasteurella multocida TaxID=747 RepID=UPI002A52EAAA|nr:recombination protein NinB [Pasteurella multocida]MDY0447125.1 recombination protein NinB [Pasteurella multocida]MDY0464526.1 recombination protein NinB [Pasteurella multocida]MDY0505064.1 recombination protein NinB [Pasteurella multocida]MDY0520776.1 recombination protein NinB [Pasteurella multocida]
MKIKDQFFLRSEQVRSNCQDFIAKLPIDDDKPLVVDIKPRTRNLEQNAKFHAMCQDVANQLEFMGRKLTMEQWKVLFISGHAMATNEKADVVPGLEGEFVNIRESSAKMSVKRMASLIEYVTAYGISHGVRFNDRYGFWGK